MMNVSNRDTVHNPKMSPEILSYWVEFLSRWILGIIFLYSGMQKIFLPYDFLSIVYGYEMTTPSLGLGVALFLPWIEVSLALFLFARCFLRTTWLLIAMLLAIFVFARVWVLYSGLVIPCGCYGIGGDIVNWKNTTVAFVLFIVALISFCRQSVPAKHTSPDLKSPCSSQRCQNR